MQWKPIDVTDCARRTCNFEYQAVPTAVTRTYLIRERPENDGKRSLTNMVEAVITAISLAEGLSPDEAVWIEFNEGCADLGLIKTFDRVTLDDWVDGDRMRPNWKRIQPGEVKALGLVGLL